MSSDFSPLPRPERPRFSADYGIETGTEGLLPWEHVAQRMAAARNYWITSTRPDGRPHAAPVWGIWLDDTLYFGTGRGSRKARNFIHNPQVNVHLESGDDVVVLEGVVEEVRDRTRLAQIIHAYAEKYPGYTSDPEFEQASVWYAVRASRAFAWREQDFARSATRWNLD